MSLLMKALEKAAKDRDDARGDAPEAGDQAAADATAGVAATPAAAASSPGPISELTLEPLRERMPEPAPAPEPARAQPAAGGARPRPAPPQASSREQAQAASILEASAAARASAPGRQLNPVLLIGIGAGVIAIGFAIYVYLQLFHPSLFYRTPPPAPRPASPVASTPAAPAAPTAAAPAPATPGAQAPVATAQVLTDGTGAATSPAAAAAAANPAEKAPEKAAEKAAEKPAPARPKPQPEPAAAPAPQPATAAAPQSNIVVSRTTTAPAVQPLALEGYDALQAGRLDAAQAAYERLLRSDTRSIDALLGLAAVAAMQGRNEEAIRRYTQVLEYEPRNALAQSALIGLLGRADPLAAESRLKSLIAREPSGFLYFTLGNLHADQAQWPQAQQAYFQAHQLEPGNADFAFNLAVGLEHLNQPKLALSFYRRAVQLAGAGGRAQFNLALAQDRISRLASQVE